MNFGPLEIGLVVLVIVLLFGGAKLPKLARSLGQKAISHMAANQAGTPGDDEFAPRNLHDFSLAHACLVPYAAR